jgi:putative tricarboxylic transport membrane protein
MRKAGFNPAAEPPNRFRQTLATLDEQFGAILTGEAFRDARATRFGPMVFPAVLGALLLCSLIGLIARGSLGREQAPEPVTKSALAGIAYVAGFVGLYTALAERAGYLLTAGVLLLALLQRLRVRWYTAATVAVLLTVGTYQLFGMYLRVPLPLGSWWGN